jgi:hypothetical protein
MGCGRLVQDELEVAAVSGGSLDWEMLGGWSWWVRLDFENNMSAAIARSS